MMKESFLSFLTRKSIVILIIFCLILQYNQLVSRTLSIPKSIETGFSKANVLNGLIPAIGNITIVSTGGDAENSTWGFNNITHTLTTTSSSAANINASVVEGYLASGDLIILGANIILNAPISSTTSNNLVMNATGNIITSSGNGITTQNGSIVLWSDSDGNADGYVKLSNSITTNGGGVWIGGSYSTNGSETTSWTPYSGGSTITVGAGYAVSDGSSYGVSLDQNASIQTAGGNISIYGYGDQYFSATNLYAGGITIKGTQITSSGGNISLEGVGYSTEALGGSTEYITGLLIHSGALINSAAGSLSMLGSLPSSDLEYASAVWIGSNQGGSASGDVTISSTTGGISITGNANHSVARNSYKDGIRLQTTGNSGDDILISSTSGPITLNGTAGRASETRVNVGLRVNSNDVDSKIAITSQSGSISLKGVNRGVEGANQVAIEFNAANAADQIKIGYDGTNPYSGDIVIQGNSIKQTLAAASSGTISLQTTGELVIEPVDDAFTILNLAGTDGNLVFDNDWNFGTSLSGLRIGKASNTKNITIGSAQTISGPITIYGGNINVNDDLNTESGNANGEVLLKGTGDIALAASKSITTKGGDVIIWANSNGSTLSDGTIVLNLGTSIVTQGGHVWMGGGSGTENWKGLTVGDGFAYSNVAGRALDLNNASIQTGAGSIWLKGQRNSPGLQQFAVRLSGVNLSSTTGDITIDGKTTSPNYSSGAVLVYEAGAIETTSGNIVLNALAEGKASADAHGIRLGLLTGPVSVKTVSGNINLIGEINEPTSTSTNQAAIVMHSNSQANSFAFTSQTGNITISGKTARESLSKLNALQFIPHASANNMRFGFDGTNSYSGNILIEGNSICQSVQNSGAGSISIKTTGDLAIQPSGDAFTHFRLLTTDTDLSFDDDWDFGTSSKSFILGKSSNTYNLKIAQPLTAAGPISLLGGNINVNENLNTSSGNADGDILLKASGNIVLAEGKSITTNGADVTLQSDADENRVGGIKIGSDIAGIFTTAISTNGGDIILSGGADPLTGFASYDAGLGAAQSTYNYAIGVFGSTLNASGTGGSGGNIIVRGNGGNSFNGLLWTVNIGGQYGANTSVKTNGTGSISILGDMSEAPANPTANNSRNAWAVIIPATIETESGSIHLTGKSNVARTNVRGFSIAGSIQSATGTITLEDLTENTSSANYTGPYINGAKFGKGSLDSSSSNVILISDKFAFDNNALVNTTGTVTVEPNDDSFSGALTVSNIDIVSSGWTLGKPTNNQNITISKNQTVDGPVKIYGNNIAINAALDVADDKINLYSSGSTTQTGAIKAKGLGLHGAGTYTLNNIANVVDTIAGGDNTTPLGSLSFTNSTKLTVGTVNPTGITSTGAITLATVTGDLLITEGITSTLSTGDAVKLYAEKDTAAGNAGTGNIIISNNGDVSIESGARALMYSGVDSLSTGLATLSGASNVRKDVDATSDLSTIDNPVGATGKYSLFRINEIVNSAPTDIDLTPTTVDENAVVGTTVGSLSTTDADEGDTFSYTLETGIGDANNSSFTVSGTTLVTAAIFDFETKDTFSVRVKVTDGGGLSFSKQFTITINDLDNEDTDGDGFLDSEEKGSDPANPVDTDGDGTPDFKDTDADNDGVPDATEKTDGTDPLDDSKYKDSDGDLVPNYVESQDTTNTADGTAYKDSDGDGVPDYVESRDGTDPNDETDFNDTDGGGVPDYIETVLFPAYGLDPTNPSTQSDDDQDSDEDGVPDYQEIKDGTDPNDAEKFEDTDEDGVPDAVEIKDGTDPNDPTKYKDSDGDLVPDYVEGNDETDTADSKKYNDTDGDGVPDYIELIDGTDPNDDTKFNDADGGGVPDYVETELFPAYGLDPTDSSKESDDDQDTDGDGTTDYEEIMNGTNPNDAPSNLTYSPSSIIAERGKEISTMIPSSEAGKVKSYEIAPALPASLVFDTLTGRISGARTVAISGTVEYTVTAKNKGGSTTSTITIVYNSAPTNISLSKRNIYEKNLVGDVIGDLSTTDVDSPESHTYTLELDGDDGLDNRFFRIVGNKLQAAAVYTFKTKSSYMINVRTTDSKGLFTEKKFTISISELPLIYGSYSEAYTNVSVPGSTNRSLTPIISKGYTSQLEIVGSNISSVSWSPATGLSSTTSLNPVFNYPSTVNYVVTITNNNGSITRIPFTVEVKDDYTIKTTNIISTRQDGINDYFVVENIQTYPDNEVTIFDVSGKVITKMSNYNNRWDGKVNGKFLATGTYYYLIRFTSRPAITHRGFITIINN